MHSIKKIVTSSLAVVFSLFMSFASFANTDYITVSEAREVAESIGAEYVSLGMFKLTAYCEGRCCNGKWVGQPTASGTDYVEGRTIAVDKKVIPLGTKIEINIPDVGWVEYTAEDTGSGIKKNRIDIFVNGHSNTFSEKYNSTCEVRISADE